MDADDGSGAQRLVLHLHDILLDGGKLAPEGKSTTVAPSVTISGGGGLGIVGHGGFLVIAKGSQPQTKSRTREPLLLKMPHYTQLSHDRDSPARSR